MRNRLVVTPILFRRLSYVALAALSLIVLTGAAVRLTGSGLGCPDWPRCYGSALPPLSYHPVIEFGNRAISGLVGIICVAVAGLAFVRRPFRRDLALVALTLPLGVLGQAVLGGVTVEDKLAPGYVMAHFGLSMLILVGAVTLAWRASHEAQPSSVRPAGTGPAGDRLVAWTVRALLPLCALTIFAGTAATASGPHAGGAPGQRISRLTFRGADTLVWVVHRHATIAALFGIVVIAAWLLVRRRAASEAQLEPLTVTGVLVAAQGLVGSVQYELKLPADMVWVHVVLATLTWLSVLWAVAAVGSLRRSPVRVPVAEGQPAMAGRELEPVGGD